MAQVLQRAWLRRGALACLLWPLSLVFGALAALRRAAFQLDLLKRHRVAVPVIVVGNVVAGGAGKTPVVMALVGHLRGRGLAVGVVSRGYGRSAADCREVSFESLPNEVGDEPLLVARTSGVPVFVAPSRAQAANALLATHPATQVIVCDDGLQHHALQRDVEICIFDERGIGNGWLLPAGPLREHWPRKVDLVLSAGAPPGIRGFTARRRLASHAVRSDGTRTLLADLAGRPLTAVAGIAKPEAFFAMLREQGLQLARTLALPDHHDFAEDPAEGHTGDLLCTEKDAVKLWRLRPDAWAVPLAMEIDAEFWRALDGLVDAKLSSAHGPQTA
ncbi:tetraacyldisaccharide 4'-kinase [Ramlibacter sp. WS9]|nr:tetraacyldisaccharide 4'-kinase [Ramlibacter sp. WS9]ROZ77152.1 tetraacyldisaccharide 4'-kinase [Ramlibacter sp. WS9]